MFTSLSLSSLPFPFLSSLLLSRSPFQDCPCLPISFPLPSLFLSLTHTYLLDQLTRKIATLSTLFQFPYSMCSSFSSLSPLSTETSEGQHAIEVEKEEQNGQSALSREKDTALNLLLAGRDTTSTTLTWFFYVISQHPEVEKKILDELKPISEAHTFEENPIIFKVEELKSSIYLNSALHEALRLFPPIPLEHKSLSPEYAAFAALGAIH